MEKGKTLNSSDAWKLKEEPGFFNLLKSMLFAAYRLKSRTIYRPLKFATDRHLEIINDNSSNLSKKEKKLNNAIKIALSTSKCSKFFYKAKSLLEENIASDYLKRILGYF